MWQFFEPPLALVEDKDQEEMNSMNNEADKKRVDFFLGLKYLAKGENAEAKVHIPYLYVLYPPSPLTSLNDTLHNSYFTTFWARDTEKTNVLSSFT